MPPRRVKRSVRPGQPPDPDDIVPTEAYDIAIVGGGAAGCVVARRLSETGDRSVVLIEAGSDPRPQLPSEWRDGWRMSTLPDWGFESEPDGTGATNKLRRGRLLGGTSWLTRFAVRGAPADFDGWAARGNPGWTFEEVLPAFRRLEDDAEFGDDPWHGKDGPIPITRYPELSPSPIHAAATDAFAAAGFPSVQDHNRPDALGAGRMPMSSRGGARVTALDGYLGSAGRPSLTIRPDSMVAAVLLQGGRATGVRLVDGTVIRAGRIVLSAGTYGSPTILMRSGIGPGDHLRALEVDVRVDLPGVGSNLADHPGVELDPGWRGTGTTGPILHTIATFRTSYASPDGAPDLLFWVTDPHGDEPGFWFESVLLKPEARGSVRLRSIDPADPPRITLPSLHEPRDIDRLAEAYRLGLELANHPSVRRLAADAAPSEPATPEAMRRRIIENSYSIPHVVGTCAMGPSPEAGAVVDALGRVHGIEGLNVIDASIIPGPPSGFPHIVTIMLAERMSAMLTALV